MDIDIYEEVSIDTEFHLENNLNHNDMIEMIKNDDYTVTFSITLEIGSGYNFPAKINEVQEVQVTTEVSKDFLLDKMAKYAQATGGMNTDLLKIIGDLQEELSELRKQVDKPVDQLRPVG